MKLFNTLVVNALAIFFVYLSFVKDITLFQVLLYIVIGLASIGIFLPDTYKNIDQYKWYNLAIGIPSSITCWYIGLNYGGDTYTYISIILNVIIYTVFLNRKFGTTL